METHKNIFGSKLKELDKDYEQFRSHVLHAHEHSQCLGEEISSLKQELSESKRILQNTAAQSCSPALSRLASVQLGYCEQMETLRGDLNTYMGETRDDQAEALALYAETAMDFAAQGVRFALLAALEAIDIQPDETEEIS